jgi:hypothetical protein
VVFDLFQISAILVDKSVIGIPLRPTNNLSFAVTKNREYATGEIE